MPARGRKCETCDHWEDGGYVKPDMPDWPVRDGYCQRDKVHGLNARADQWCGQWTPIPEGEESEESHG